MMATAPRASDDPAHDHEPTRSAGDDANAVPERDGGGDPSATFVDPSPERPWPLIAAAAACIVAAIVGALGPWFEYERISETNPGTWTTPGYQSGGFFIIVFATAALVTLGAALLRERGEPLAWVAFAGMALCTVIVVSVWTDPPRQTIPSGGVGTIGRLGWGPMVVIFAAPIGALLLFLTARQLTASDD
jgi:hypothetical protein